jgi:hypothetical protein
VEGEFARHGPATKGSTMVDFRGTVLTEDSLRDLTYYLRLISRYRQIWLVASVCALNSLALRLPMPLLAGYIIDKVLAAKQERQLDAIAASLVFVTLFYIWMNYSSGRPGRGLEQPPGCASYPREGSIRPQPRPLFPQALSPQPSHPQPRMPMRRHKSWGNTDESGFAPAHTGPRQDRKRSGLVWEITAQIPQREALGEDDSELRMPKIAAHGACEQKKMQLSTRCPSICALAHRHDTGSRLVCATPGFEDSGKAKPSPHGCSPRGRTNAKPIGWRGYEFFGRARFPERTTRRLRAKYAAEEIQAFPL